jgi:hypothetical protein
MLAATFCCPRRTSNDGRHQMHGPGSLHAPLLISLNAGLVIGFLPMRDPCWIVGKVAEGRSIRVIK